MRLIAQRTHESCVPTKLRKSAILIPPCEYEDLQIQKNGKRKSKLYGCQRNKIATLERQFSRLQRQKQRLELPSIFLNVEALCDALFSSLVHAATQLPVDKPSMLHGWRLFLCFYA